MEENLLPSRVVLGQQAEAVPEGSVGVGVDEEVGEGAQAADQNEHEAANIGGWGVGVKHQLRAGDEVQQVEDHKVKYGED